MERGSGDLRQIGGTERVIRRTCAAGWLCLRRKADRGGPRGNWLPSSSAFRCAAERPSTLIHGLESLPVRLYPIGGGTSGP